MVIGWNEERLQEAFCMLEGVGYLADSTLFVMPSTNNLLWDMYHLNGVGANDCLQIEENGIKIEYLII